MTALVDALRHLAREGELYERLREGRVRCYACGHRCLIPPGQRGVCKMTDRGATPVKTLLRAAELGLGEGLRYVYAGNLPGRVGALENTHCPGCRALLIERVGYTIRRDLVTPGGGACPSCGTTIPGRW